MQVRSYFMYLTFLYFVEGWYHPVLWITRHDTDGIPRFEMYEINRTYLLCKHIYFILATWLPSHCHIDRLILSSHCYHIFPCTIFDNMTMNINTHRHIYFSMSKYIFYHVLFSISSYSKILSLPIYVFIGNHFTLNASNFL